ncbi:MAG: 3-deoxy-D-manno-octulosonic acid transferase, partial [Prolixibacteraceae bacterium]|nr:3-deoxy-D-manno-octulosonic acid transferase [Prolixibacteraceae bacterium]
MRIIYELGLHIYALIAFVISPFNRKSHQWCSGRKKTFRYLNSRIKDEDSILWMHCASLGEFEQGRPLIESIKKKYPEYKIILTFFSPSGYEIRKDYAMADYICYLPLDTRRNARKFISMVHPKKVFFIKYEFWMNYIRELSLHKIPLYLVSSIFNSEQLFFKKSIGASWYRKILFRVSYFFVQNQQSSDLLSEIGIKNTMIIGDTRFDRVAEIAAQNKDLPLIEQFKGTSKLIIAGSSWPPDEKLLTEYFNKNKKTKVIFAPHEIKETNIKRLISLFHEPVLIYSKANNDTDVNKYRIMIIDCVG